MSEVKICGLAAETRVETPEGSMAIRTCAGKAIPILTHNEQGGILFRMMLDVRKVAEGHPVLKVALENGASFRVAPEQIFLRADMQSVAAASLRPGVGLMPAFHYPTGYAFSSDAGDNLVSERSLKVVSIEPAATADIFALRVHQTGCFFLAAGVLCQAEGE